MRGRASLSLQGRMPGLYPCGSKVGIPRSARDVLHHAFWSILPWQQLEPA